MGQTQVCVVEFSSDLQAAVDGPAVSVDPQTQESGKIKASWSRPTFDRWVSIYSTMIGSLAEMNRPIFSRYLGP